MKCLVTPPCGRPQRGEGTEGALGQCRQRRCSFRGGREGGRCGAARGEQGVRKGTELVAAAPAGGPQFVPDQLEWVPCAMAAHGKLRATEIQILREGHGHIWKPGTKPATVYPSALVRISCTLRSRPGRRTRPHLEMWSVMTQNQRHGAEVAQGPRRIEGRE